MLVFQTAFVQETSAILRAGRRVSDLDGRRVIDIAGQRCLVVETGIGLAAAGRAMRELLDRVEKPELVVSIGLAGALEAQWAIGDWAVIEAVCLDESVVQRPASKSVSRWALAPVFAAALQGASDVHLPFGQQETGASAHRLTRLDAARRATLVSLKRPAFSSEMKLELSQRVAAQLCDMETYAVAKECDQRQVPWMGLRVVSDTFREEILEWTTALPMLLSHKCWFRVAGLVATHPQDIPTLVRLGFRMHALQRRLTQLTQDLVTHVQSA